MLGLIGVGLLLRLPSLRLGLWRDEGSTYFDALPSQWSEVIQTTIYSELNPPGFFLIMHQWMQWFGSHEVVFKIPALIFGVLLIPAIYWLAQVTYSQQTGLIAAAIAAFAPEAIYYSQEARPYTLTTLLCCIVVTFYYKAIKTQHVRYLIGFVLCSALLLYVQYTGCLLLIGLGGATLYLWWRQPKQIRLLPLAIAFSLIFILFLPWLPVFLTHLQVGAPWSPKEYWIGRPVIFLNHIGYTLLIPTPGGLFSLVALALGLKVAYQKRHAALNKPSTHKPLSNASLLLGITVLLCAAMLAVLSYNTKRYMLPFAPLAWVVYASLLVQLLKSIVGSVRFTDLSLRRRSIIGLLVLLLVIPSAIDVWSLGIDNKSGIRPLSADILAQPDPKTFYLLSPDYFGPTFGYYFSGSKVQFHGFARWDHPERFSPQGYADLWNRTTLMADTDHQIQTYVQQGYQSLGLIQSKREIRDGGQIQYGHANELLDWLRQTYPLLSQKEYQARNEPVILYRFSLVPRL